jgi:hypothetical protein
VQPFGLNLSRTPTHAAMTEWRPQEPRGDLSSFVAAGIDTIRAE